MTIWVLCGLLVLFVVIVLVVSLCQKTEDTSDHLFEAQFYKHQIEDIERDHQKGVLTNEEMLLAKAETGRRLLRFADKEDKKRKGTSSLSSVGTRDDSNPVSDDFAQKEKKSNTSSSRNFAICFILMVIPISCVFYLNHDSKSWKLAGLSQQELTAQGNKDAETKARSDASLSMETMIAKVEERIKTQPDDGRAWQFLSLIRLEQKRPQEAEEAFKKAVELSGENSDYYISYVDKIIQANNFIVTARAKELLDKVLQIDPASSRAKLFLALFTEQQGDEKKALEYYQDVADKDPTSEEGQIAREQVVRLSGTKQGQTDNTGVGADMHAMVDGLAQRLIQNGGTLMDWERVIRSYLVLERRGDAQKMLKFAKLALSNDASALQQLTVIGEELKLEEVEKKP